MLVCIPDVIDAELVALAGARLAAAAFVDGKATAGWHARLVKDNLQTARGDDALDELKSILAQRIGANDLVKVAARPKRLTPLILSRYDPGMTYGTHVDDALMGQARTDVSFTLFLSDPDSYDGGELVMESTAGEQGYKLAAGGLVLYPSTTLHRVEPVTRGQRLAAVGWMTSRVRDAGQREILFDLDAALRLVFAQSGKSHAFDLLSKCAANLLRRWAED